MSGQIKGTVVPTLNVYSLVLSPVDNEPRTIGSAVDHHRVTPHCDDGLAFLVEPFAKDLILDFHDTLGTGTCALTNTSTTYRWDQLRVSSNWSVSRTTSSNAPQG